MAEQKLAAEVRTEFGKGFARRARMAGQIPAVIYGHGAEPIHITLPAKSTTLAVRVANALLTLDINGEQHLALVKDIQRDPIKQIIEHLDLLTVRTGEKVTVDVPVHLTGELAPGNVYNQEMTVVSLEAEATHLHRHRGQHRRPHRGGAHPRVGPRSAEGISPPGRRRVPRRSHLRGHRGLRGRGLGRHHGRLLGRSRVVLPFSPVAGSLWGPATAVSPPNRTILGLTHE
ncbi:50S ribosomal protein L25 [Arthrobacter sp. Hiyo6]|nr:50S ribosomal protein L25 [Arthrobacter sp. Hiyo6]